MTSTPACACPARKQVCCTSLAGRSPTTAWSRDALPYAIPANVSSTMPVVVGLASVPSTNVFRRPTELTIGLGELVGQKSAPGGRRRSRSG